MWTALVLLAAVIVDRITRRGAAGLTQCRLSRSPLAARAVHD